MLNIFFGRHLSTETLLYIIQLVALSTHLMYCNKVVISNKGGISKLLKISGGWVVGKNILSRKLIL